MYDQSPIIGDDEAVQRLPFYVVRPEPSLIPTPNIFEEPTRCLKINEHWASHFLGVLDALDQPDTWIGTEEEIEAARNQVREAIAMFSKDCDMCCGEEIALLTQVVTQNTEINSTNYSTQYQNFVTNNQTIYEDNRRNYDGTPQSIDARLGANFNTGDSGNDQLCAAIKNYIDTMVYVYGMQAAFLSGVAGVITGIGLALAPVSLGTSLIGVAVGAAIGGGNALWNSVINDPEAQRDIACCMFDSLKDQPMTQAVFKASLDGCTTDGVYDSNTGFLSAQMHATNQLDENWLAFLKSLSNSYGQGNEQDCMCDCENGAEIVTSGTYGNIVTYMGNCIWRSEQPTPVYEEPAIDVARYYHGWKDLLDRCIFIEAIPFGQEYATVPTSDHRETNCAGVDLGWGVGGGGGTVKSMDFRMGEGYQYYKITLVE
jgi:hypothetical protein